MVVNEDVKKNVAKPYPMNLVDLVLPILGVIPKVILAYCVYHLQYPTLLLKAKTWRQEWMFMVLFRNLVGTLIICCSWDWLLYLSPIKKKLQPYKFNVNYPPTNQMLHDMIWTLSSSFWASVLECVALNFWATGVLPYYSDFWGNRKLYNILSVALVTFWRISHFHLIHRAMHPWRTRIIPDIGRIFYKHVHALHHKSYNPSTFSGTSMHPFEGFLYYTASFMPWLIGSAHPFTFLVCHFDLAIGAWLGHDGFQFPGMGSYFHYLHHAHFEINYGDTLIPWDWIFGTFGSGPTKTEDSKTYLD
jgi:sterol desaturase/sphingolipid hydroxylase (fatty acid hydroxylase superfamily)